MMKGGVSILGLLCVALILSSASCASRRHSHKMQAQVVDPTEPRKSWSSQEGIEHVVGAHTFAFGPIGPAERISDGEFAIRAIMKNPDAPQLFKTAYAQATAEGQLYALCGIHVTSPDSFDDYASPLRNQTRDVKTMSGNITTNEPMVDVVQRITAGNYDRYFTNRPTPPVQPSNAGQ